MKDIITKDFIILDLPPESHEDAIRRAGKLLVDAGACRPRYVEGMLARDKAFSTAIGNYIAIPHGEKEYKEDIIKTKLSVLTYPKGIDWGGQTVYLVIGIAAIGDEHLEILENIVDKLEDGDDTLALVKASDKDAIAKLFAGDGQ
jgi:mannitol/fructose-specific phosphotransferase system IIA component